MNSGNKPDIGCSEAARWFTRLQSGALSDSEQKRYDAWLEQDAGNRIAIAELGVLWEASGSCASEEQPADAALRPAGITRRYLAGVSIAAAVLAVAGILTGVLLESSEVYRTGVGEQQIVSLPDGSRVHLNTESTLVVAFSDGLRAVELRRGEAIFDVAHDQTRPFEVRAGAGRVRALGTVFNVRADESEVIITVLEGSVRVQADRVASVETADGFEAPVLEASEEVRYSTEGLVSEVTSSSLRRIEGWRAGRVDLEDVSLSEAAREMNRYATTKLMIGDNRLNAYRISGVFRIGDVDGMVAGLTSAFPIRAVYRQDSVVLLADEKATD